MFFFFFFFFILVSLRILINFCLFLFGNAIIGINGERTRVCECKHFTDGQDCEKCLPFYNDAPWGRATSKNVHECKRKLKWFSFSLFCIESSIDQYWHWQMKNDETKQNVLTTFFPYSIFFFFFLSFFSHL